MRQAHRCVRFVVHAVPLSRAAVAGLEGLLGKGALCGSTPHGWGGSGNGENAGGEPRGDSHHS